MLQRVVVIGAHPCFDNTRKNIDICAPSLHPHVCHTYVRVWELQGQVDPSHLRRWNYLQRTPCNLRYVASAEDEATRIHSQKVTREHNASTQSHGAQTRTDLMGILPRRGLQIRQLSSAIAFAADTLAQELSWSECPLHGWSGCWSLCCRKFQDFAQVDPILASFE